MKFSGLEHIYHLEELPIVDDINGIETAIAFIEAFRHYGFGTHEDITLMEKVDGSPAFIVGNLNFNPLTGEIFDDYRTFVSTKGFFNKITPYSFYSHEDINNSVLSDSLKLALTEIFDYLLPILQKNHIEGIFQGDLLYSSERPYKIDRNTIFVSPNPTGVTMFYPLNSDLGESTIISRIGVSLHTQYIQSPHDSSWQPKPSTIDFLNDRWCIDSIDQVLFFSSEMSKSICFSKIHDDFTELNYNYRFSSFIGTLKKCNDDIVLDSSRFLGILKTEAESIRRYMNHLVRIGCGDFYNGSLHLDEYIQWLEEVKEDRADRFVMNAKRDEYIKRMNKRISDIKAQYYTFKQLFIIVRILSEVKNIMIDILNNCTSKRYFLNGEYSGPEGFVIYNNTLGYTKLVDRRPGGFAHINLNRNEYGE